MSRARQRTTSNSSSELSLAALRPLFEHLTLCLKINYRHGSSKSLEIRRINYEMIVRLRQVCRHMHLSDDELHILWYETYALRPHNKLNLIPFGQCMAPNMLRRMKLIKPNSSTKQRTWFNDYMNSVEHKGTWLHVFNETLIDIASMIEHTPSNTPFKLHPPHIYKKPFKWKNGPMRKVNMLRMFAYYLYQYLKFQNAAHVTLTCNACGCKNKLPFSPTVKVDTKMCLMSSSVYSILHNTFKIMHERVYWVRLLDAVTIIQCERMFDSSQGIVSFLPEERINSSFCSNACYWLFMEGFTIPSNTFRPLRTNVSETTNNNIVKLHADDGMVRDKGFILENLMSAMERNSTVCSFLKRRQASPHFMMMIRGLLALDTMILMCSHQLMLTHKAVAPNIPGRSLQWRKHTPACIKQFVDNCTSSRTVVNAFRVNAIDGVLHRSQDIKQQALVEWCRQQSATIFIRRCET